MKSIPCIAASVAVVVTALFLITGAPAPAAAAEPVRHQVIKGDDLHLLAGYYYRNPRRWKEIYAANRKAVREANVLVPGSLLTIPDQDLKPFPAPFTEWRAMVQR